MNEETCRSRTSHWQEILAAVCRLCDLLLRFAWERSCQIGVFVLLGLVVGLDLHFTPVLTPVVLGFWILNNEVLFILRNGLLLNLLGYMISIWVRHPFESIVCISILIDFQLKIVEVLGLVALMPRLTPGVESLWLIEALLGVGPYRGTLLVLLEFVPEQLSLVVLLVVFRLLGFFGEWLVGLRPRMRVEIVEVVEQQVRVDLVWDYHVVNSFGVNDFEFLLWSVNLSYLLYLLIIVVLELLLGKFELFLFSLKSRVLNQMLCDALFFADLYPDARVLLKLHLPLALLLYWIWFNRLDRLADRLVGLSFIQVLGVGVWLDVYIDVHLTFGSSNVLFLRNIKWRLGVNFVLGHFFIWLQLILLII